MPAHVPAAARALALFEVFAREKTELTNSELAKHLDLPESSCSDLVSTLMDAGYLARTLKSRRLYPTGRLFGIASEVNRNDPTSAWLKDACEVLRDKTGETTLGGLIENGSVRVSGSFEGRHPLRYTSMHGEKISLHVSAMGKAILSLGTPEEALAQLKLKPMRKLAAGTVTDLAVLARQIAQFRRQKFAYVENEGGDGLAALAVAGRINQEAVALCIAGPVERVSLHRKAYLEELKQVAAEIFTEA